MRSQEPYVKTCQVIVCDALLRAVEENDRKLIKSLNTFFVTHTFSQRPVLLPVVITETILWSSGGHNDRQIDRDDTAHII